MEDYEGFTPQQLKILEHFVTNTRQSVFALRNLPEVIKGVLFSRYSRSTLGLRSLLLKEFILNEEAAFLSIVGNLETPHEGDVEERQLMAIQKAQNFYDRILDGYGDDSIAELGGASLALENISIIATKLIEDCRIGGSPLEKSTRYVYFDQKVNGQYLFYREPILMTSAFRDLYLDTCNMLFETYSKLIPTLTTILEEKTPKDPTVSKAAYTAALRAKVLDCIRGLLPASTLTNMGLYGNGRFFETLIHKMRCHNLAELKELGAQSFDELSKIIPSFIKRAEANHKYHLNFASYSETIQTELKAVASHVKPTLSEGPKRGVTLIQYNKEDVFNVAAAMLYNTTSHSLQDLQSYCRKLPEEELMRILDIGSSYRENRRQKSPRALEHAHFTFEITADFGIYRDLHRHRMLTQERHFLTCNHGFWMPPEISDTPMEKEYVEALEQAQEAYKTIASELPEEAQYVVPMAYNVRWYFHVNLRALQWICELRSSPAGHPAYRFIAQEMAKQVSTAIPAFERFFKFVDYDGYEMGRLGQEIRRVEKTANLRSN